MPPLTSSTIPKHIHHLPLSLRRRISLNGGTSASLLPLISSLALTKCLPRADLTDGYQSAAEIHQPNGLLTGVILTSIYIVFVSGGGSGGARRCDGPDANTWNISFRRVETALHWLSLKILFLIVLGPGSTQGPHPGPKRREGNTWLEPFHCRFSLKLSRNCRGKSCDRKCRWVFLIRGRQQIPRNHWELVWNNVLTCDTLQSDGHTWKTTGIKDSRPRLVYFCPILAGSVR